MQRLADRRVLVVGASSGIGRAIALALGAEGARVAVAARRAERLAELAASLSGGSAVSLDVRDPAGCAAGVGEAARALGGLDAMVYSVGSASPALVADVDADAWRGVFETNVTGASLVMRAALPHLVASRGRALFISSISPDDRPPRRGLGPYLVSKAALNKLVDVWQVENPAVAFTRVSVGDTLGTEFGAEFGPAIGPFVQEWIARGLMFGRGMQPETVARHVADLLACEEAVSESRLVPRFAVEDAKPWAGD
jgi:NAD(P)-dependent dehydrogenase (short-subunit alcohol dehydrogenase family)